jgi:hypothetical protein
MNLEQIVKETVAKIVAEKQGKDLTGDGKIDSADYLKARSNAIEKAKGLDEDHEDHEVAMAQDSLDSVIRAAMELKARLGDDEKNIPAWIQDHITNSENYIYQAAKSYHEYNAEEGETDEMNEGNLNHNELSSIEQEGRFWIVTYNTPDGNKEKSFESEDEARKFYNGLDEVFKPKSSFDDYSIGDNVTVKGKKAKITSMEMDDETGERRARVRFEDDSVEKVSINSLDENIMTTNEGRSAEDVKQGQLDQAYDHLEKIKEKPKLFSSEDIKKAEARIEKLEAELDALAAKSTNEALDEATVRRWQHYAGLK